MGGFRVSGDADIEIKIGCQPVASVKTEISDSAPFIHKAGVRDVEDEIVLVQEFGVFW